MPKRRKPLANLADGQHGLPMDLSQLPSKTPYVIKSRGIGVLVEHPDGTIEGHYIPIKVFDPPIPQT